MPSERGHGPVVDNHEVYPFKIEPDTEVHDALKMESRRDGVVPSPDELASVVVE